MRPVFWLALTLAACSEAAPARTPAPAHDAGGSGGGGGEQAPSCEAGRTLCSGACVDLARSVESCGTCGRSCAPGQVCNDGSCAAYCAPPLLACDGACTDVARHEAHCGACDTACGAGEYCREGSCTLHCEEGLTACQGSCVDLAGDPAHCGACGRACDPAGACVSGSCEPPCPAPELLCGESCVDVTSSTSHCGACDRPCGAEDVCTGGTCGPVPVSLETPVSWTTVDVPEVLRIPVYARMSDGSRRDVSSEVRWTTGAPDVIEVAGQVLLPMAAGDIGVFAVLGTLQARVNVSVRPWHSILIADGALHASLSGVNQGDALVGFALGNQVQVARYTPGKGWAAPVVAASRSVRPLNVVAGLAGRGDRIVLWTENGTTLYGAQAILDRAFSSAVRLDRLGTAVSAVGLSVSHVGRGLVTFSQVDRDEGTSDLHATVITASGFGAPTLLADAATGAPGIDNLGNGVALAASDAAVEAHLLTASTTWGEASALGAGAGLSSPLLGMDAFGNGVALWVEDLGPSRLLHASSYTAGKGWSTVTDVIEGDLIAPGLGMNLGGPAIATWIVPEGDGHQAFASVRDAGGSWSAGERVDAASTGSVLEINGAIDGDGAAIVVWTEVDAAGRRVLLANHRHPERGWGLPYVVSRSARFGSIGRPQVAANYLHVPVVIWTELRPDGSSLLYGATVP